MDIKIKDFILDEIPTNSTTSRVARNQTEYNFDVIYENNSDFIIRKTTQKTSRVLVVIVSKGQCYIKNEKNGEIDNVVSVEQLTKFKTGLDDVPNFEKLEWKPFSTTWRDKIQLTDAFENFIHYKETYKDMLSYNMKPWTYGSYRLSGFASNPNTYRKESQHKKIINLFDTTFTPNDSFYATVCNTLDDCHLDYNKIQRNLDLIAEIGAYPFRKMLYSGQFTALINEYKCDFRALLTFVLYTIKFRNGLEIENGYYSNSFTISDYADFLRMQQTMYGKIKNKYPTYWLSEKQMLNNKYNAWVKVRTLEGDLFQDKILKYAFEDDVYKVIVPTKVNEILDEAEQQQHCLASYVTKIQHGETNVVFIRQKLNEEDSCLTVEIRNGKIVQVRGFQNRCYNALEYSFIEKWAKEVKLELGVNAVV